MSFYLLPINKCYVTNIIHNIRLDKDKESGEIRDIE
jgi:hypothetical protein